LWLGIGLDPANKGGNLKKIIVFGVGTFGYRLAIRTAELGAHVTTIDRRNDILEQVRDLVAEVQVIEFTDEVSIKEKLKEGFDTAVIAMHRNFGTVLLLCMYVREMNIPHIVARAETSMQRAVLAKLNIEDIILPELEMGNRVAERLILNKSEQLVLTHDEGIVHIPVPKSLIGHKIGQIPQLEKYKIKILQIRREYVGEKYSRMIDPNDPNFELIENDFLVLIGRTRKIAKFLEAMTS
jgi:trk system potassium uptake protein TrkA